jgi:hypothetical protein
MATMQNKNKQGSARPAHLQKVQTEAGRDEAQVLVVLEQDLSLHYQFNT